MTKSEPELRTEGFIPSQRREQRARTFRAVAIFVLIVSTMLIGVYSLKAVNDEHRAAITKTEQKIDDKKAEAVELNQTEQLTNEANEDRKKLIAELDEKLNSTEGFIQ